MLSKGNTLANVFGLDNVLQFFLYIFDKINDNIPDNKIEIIKDPVLIGWFTIARFSII